MAYDEEDEATPVVLEPTQEYTEEVDLPQCHRGGSTGVFSLEGSTTAFGSNGSETVSSFEGHVSTAAMALRQMLEGPTPGVFEAETKSEDDHRYSRPGRESFIEYMDMERPSVSLIALLVSSNSRLTYRIPSLGWREDAGPSRHGSITVFAHQLRFPSISLTRISRKIRAAFPPNPTSFSRQQHGVDFLHRIITWLNRLPDSRKRHATKSCSLLARSKSTPNHRGCEETHIAPVDLFLQLRSRSPPFAPS